MSAAEDEAKASKALAAARAELTARIGEDPDSNGGWLDDVCGLAADVDALYGDWCLAYDAMQAERGIVETKP